MIRFRVLGSVALTRPDETEVRAVLAQPKQTAVLAYLALGIQNGFHHRDSLLAVFWPELDSDHARAALSKSVHHLRRELGDAVLISRGDGELALNDEMFWCDAVTFESELKANRREEALAMYYGDLLEGFHLSRAPDFERWLERERARLKELACRACIGLADALTAKGELTRAAEWAQRALSISPYEELVLRRLVGVLDRSGDRAGALRAYEGFTQRLASDLEMQPSAETTALAEAVRARHTPHALPELGFAPTQESQAAQANVSRVRLRRARVFPAALFLLLCAVSGGLLWRLPRAQSSEDSVQQGSVVGVPADGRAMRSREAKGVYREGLKQAERWSQVAGNRERVRLAPIVISLFQDAIAKDSTLVEAYVELAIQHLRIHWFGLDQSDVPVQLAWAALSKALQLRSDAPDVHRGLGYYYYWADRDYARASQQFTLALRQRPDDWDMESTLAAVLRRQGKLEDAVNRFEHAVALNPSGLAMHSALCETLLGMRSYPEAERCLWSLVEKEPGRPFSHAYLMRLYVLWRGDIAKVRAVLESAGRSIAPAELPLNWTDLYLFERNYAAALVHLDPALVVERDADGRGINSQNEPYSVRAHLLAAWVHSKMGQADQARDLYALSAAKIERGPSALPSLGGRHTWLAVAYAGLGRRDEAVREARAAERLFRSSNDVWSWPTYLEFVTQAYVIAGEYDVALDRIEELLSLRYSLALSPARLRVDPRWDPLRKHPRFQKLLTTR